MAEVLSVSASSDGRLVASGGRDGVVRVFDTRTLSQVEAFTGHRDTIMGVCFRPRSRSLYSASADRTIKHWDVGEGAYVETLYGHQAEVHCCDSLLQERCLSGGHDRSVRLWKIPEESHLAFSAQMGDWGSVTSIDCVRMVTEQLHVSGGDDGAICLWSNAKKKPVDVVTGAHVDADAPSSSTTAPWITSLATQRHTDLLASGSCDGFIRLWGVDLEQKSLFGVGAVPLDGFVNGMAFASDGRFVVAGVGQEHRLGRWTRVREARNGLHVVPLPQN